MKKRLLITLLVVSALAVIAFLCTWDPIPDPIHGGKKLSEWIKQLDSEPFASRQEAALALKQAGRPGVPLLIKTLLSSEDSSLQRAWKWVLAKLPPSLTGKLTDPGRFRARGEIASVLGQIEYDPRIAPALVTALNDRDPEVRRESAMALRYVDKRDAALIIPALGRALDDQANNVREAAAFALASFGKDARQFIPQLIRNLKPGGSTAYWAAKALGSMGGEAEAAIPALQQCLKSSDIDEQRGAAVALWKIDPKKGTPLPLLKSIMRGPDSQARLHAAQDIWGLDKQQAEVILPVLIDLLNEEMPPNGNHYSRIGAAKLLAEIGPDAKAAIPALQVAASDQNKEVRSNAQLALKEIESRQPAKKQ